MARSVNNPVMQGSTGRIGKTSFRRTIFGTVIANRPDYGKKAQAKNRLNSGNGQVWLRPISKEYLIRVLV